MNHQSRYTALIPAMLLVLSLALAGVAAVAAESEEEGSPAAVLSEPGVILLEGTNVDAALAPALSSSIPVPVIIVLKNQPARALAEAVQDRYLPRAHEKSRAVRGILARYAGPRKFNSVQEMREQASREAAAVTPSDRARVKALNAEADALLDEMRNEVSKELRLAVAADQSRLTTDIAAVGGRVNYGYSIRNAVAAVVPGSSLIALSRNPLVSHIVVDRLSTASMDVSGPSIFVDSFWTPGYDGGIWDGAIMDTGVDTAHPGLNDDTVGARTWYSHTFHATAVGWANYDDNSASTDDLQGHGTHVAGTVFSSDATNRGIAFGADIGMNLKSGFLATDGKGYSYDSDAHAALDWSSQQPETESPEAVNYSFGGDAATDDDTNAQYFDSFVEYEVASAMIAAGNSGPGANTVETPGIAYNVITVANMSDGGTTDRTGDTISGSSSHGPTQGGRRKPDISAPGSSIMSANFNWEGAGADYVNKSGTSMATPHITGAALLLCDVGVTDPREIKGLLVNTADDWGAAGWDATYGWGYVNLAQAYLHRGDSGLYSVNENAMTGDYKLFKTTGMDAGEKATMVWYRHAVYNGASNPTTVYSLNDLNLRLYDESNNASIDSDTSSIDNVHQVVSDRSGTQVIRAYSVTNNFSHGSNSETFALAYQEGTTLAADPTVTPSAGSYTPPLYAKFTATVTVQNTGDVAAHNVSVTLALPAGVILSEGSLTQNLGTIAAGSSAYAYYTLDTTSGGVKTLNISTSSSSYGLAFTGSGSFTVTPDPQDFVDPYTTLTIGQPTYQTGGTDKIANGGFESGLISWTTSGAAIESGSAHGGSNNIRLGPGTGSAYQSVSIGAGANPAVLTFWYKSSASFLASAGCSIQDSGGATLIYPFSTTSSQGSWTKKTIDVGRFKGQTIRVNFYSVTGFFGGSSTLYVDDVSVKEGEQVWVDDTNQHSLASRDDNSGVDYSEYHIGGDPFTTYSSPFTLAGKPEWSNYVYYRSVDNGANYESTITGLLYLDTKAPVSVMRVYTPWSLVGGTEKVSNGGFESNLTGWTTSGIVSAVNSPVRTGIRAAKIGGTGAGSIYQDIPVSVAASRAFLHCYVKSTAGAGSSYIRIALIDPDTGLSCYGAGFNFTADWTEYAWDVSRFKGRTVRAQFDVFLTSGGAATAYIDDVSVRDDGNAYILPSTTLSIYSAESCGVQTYESKIDAGVWVAGQSLTIPAAGLHNVRYRALDNLNHQESDVLTQFNVDQTGPTGSIVINGGAQYTTSTTVTLSLSASDPAGVNLMRIRSDTGVWGAWQAYQSSISYTFTSAAEGTKDIGVQYTDLLGNIGSIYSDTIEYRSPTVMSISGAKQTADGRGVRLKDKIVTAVFPLSGYFYIEESDRTSGIRVRSADLPGINTFVTVDGITATVFAEHEIAATLVAPGGAATAVKPLELNNKALGGGPFGYQPGVPGSSGLSNIGLLVRTTGRVVRHFAGTFYIDDGSPIIDSWLGHPAVLIDDQALGGWVPPLGSYVAVTGASGMETLSGSPIRSLRPRGVGDIQIFQADAAYIYLTNVTDAQSFKNLLDSQSIRTDIIAYGDIGRTDWSKYDVILLGGDTGAWPDAGVVNTVLGANTPIIGVGEGGTRFLDAVPGLFIGWGQSGVGAETHGVVVGGNIYTYPYNFNVVPGNSIALYAPAVTTVELYDPNGVSERMLRSLTLANYYPVAREAGRYYQWGYYGPPSAMTQAGRNLFTNLVFRTLVP
ncbi:MAG: S8 family serine peptidase [Armatimonadetes bacterium]|nr:S8 family serine peptidase [Armatimonadota bacterium]